MYERMMRNVQYDIRLEAHAGLVGFTADDDDADFDIGVMVLVAPRFTKIRRDFEILIDENFICQTIKSGHVSLRVRGKLY